MGQWQSQTGGTLRSKLNPTASKQTRVSQEFHGQSLRQEPVLDPQARGVCPLQATQSPRL